MDFNAPSQEWGGADPRSYKSGDGTWFHGALETLGGALKLVIYHTDAAGVVIGAPWTDHGIVGQGGLVYQPVDGDLTAQGYVGYGADQTRRIVPVPGWVKPALGGGSATLPARYKTALERLCAFFGI